ncbi:MAG: DUF4292 domain-containing protein [Muribaculaceae bacterium]|nr:DUF4292 domain-containing protein [Muribaculaceae bacterium]
MRYKIYGAYAVCALLGLMFLAGCNSKKDAVEGEKYMPSSSVQKRYEEITAEYKPWQSFTTSAKVTVSMGKSLSSNAQFSMEKDKWISISVRPFLGIEMIRLYIDNDSAFLVDKTHKAVVALGLKQFTSDIPVTIGDLQDMFLGRAFLLGSGTIGDSNRKDINMVLNDSNGNFTMIPKQKFPGFNYGYTYNNENDLQQLLITIDGSSAIAPWVVSYSGAVRTENGIVTRNVSLNTELNEKAIGLDAVFDINKIKWNIKLDDSPGFKSDYKRLTISQFMKLW